VGPKLNFRRVEKRTYPVSLNFALQEKGENFNQWLGTPEGDYMGHRNGRCAILHVSEKRKDKTEKGRKSGTVEIACFCGMGWGNEGGIKKFCKDALRRNPWYHVLTRFRNLAWERGNEGRRWTAYL